MSFTERESFSTNNSVLTTHVCLAGLKREDAR